MPAVKEHPSFAGTADVYRSSNLTSPGIAADAPDFERTDIGTPAWSDMPWREQRRFLDSRTKWLRFLSCSAQEPTGNSVVIFSPVAATPSVTSSPKPATPMRSVQDQIAAVRSSLSLQMKELAQAIGVERPTVYSWLNDRNTPHAGNRERLLALYRIARKWDRLSPTPLGKQLHEADPQGVSIFSLLTQTPIPMLALDARLTDAARRAALKAPSRGLSVRELAEKHGIDLSRVADRQDEIDLETGKGFLPE